MVYILKPGEDAALLRKKIDAFLAERGLKVREAKTRLTNMQDGFDFLGWHFYTQKNNQKFRSRPSKANYEAFATKVKKILTNSCLAEKAKADKSSSILRGWRTYHQYCRMEGSDLSLWRLSHSGFKRFLKGKTTSKDVAVELISRAFPEVSYRENGFIEEGDLQWRVTF